MLSSCGAEIRCEGSGRRIEEADRTLESESGWKTGHYSNPPEKEREETLNVKSRFDDMPVLINLNVRDLGSGISIVVVLGARV